MEHNSTADDSSTDSERHPTGLPKTTDVIQPGDVVHDLAQGQPMQVIERAADSVEEWNETNGTDLLEYYGNARLGATYGDRVYSCVYVSDLTSEPSKPYDFPSSRLGRIEVEAAHPEGDRVQDVLRRETLARLFFEADGKQREDLLTLARDAFEEDGKLIRDAQGLAETRRADGGNP